MPLNAFIEILTIMKQKDNIKYVMNGIATKALDLLINNGSLDSAKRLSNAIDKGNYISLDIGDIDWEIETALEKIGGYGCVVTNRIGYGARFYFNKTYEIN